MVKVYIAQNDDTGEFYLTDDSDLSLHGFMEMTDEEWAKYQKTAGEYDDWQLRIGGQIRRNRNADS